MKALTPQQVLAQYACRLRNSDPKAWEEFVECFDAYATEVTVAVTNAPQTEILNVQGRAQAFLSLLDTFRNCQRHANPPQKE
jgi:hypothetical protein